MITIEHRPDDRRYIVIDGAAQETIGEEAYVDVAEGNSRDRVLYHTEVSENYAGQGIGSRLVRFAVEDAVAHGYRIVPVCPYVARWIEKHPAFASHTDTPSAAHRAAIPR